MAGTGGLIRDVQDNIFETNHNILYTNVKNNMTIMLDFLASNESMTFQALASRLNHELDSLLYAKKISDETSLIQNEIIRVKDVLTKQFASFRESLSASDDGDEKVDVANQVEQAGYISNRLSVKNIVQTINNSREFDQSFQHYMSKLRTKTEQFERSLSNANMSNHSLVKGGIAGSSFLAKNASKISVTSNVSPPPVTPPVKPPKQPVTGVMNGFRFIENMNSQSAESFLRSQSLHEQQKRAGKHSPMAKRGNNKQESPEKGPANLPSPSKYYQYQHNDSFSKKLVEENKANGPASSPYVENLQSLYGVSVKEHHFPNMIALNSIYYANEIGQNSTPKNDTGHVAIFSTPPRSSPSKGEIYSPDGTTAKTADVPDGLEPR
jgi:hypothetical protein